jgi:porin
MAGRKAFAALVAAGLGTLAPAAWADTANPAPQSPEATTIVPQVLGNQKHADPWQPLIDRGIRLALNYTGEAAANPVGGDRQDAAYAGQVYMGVDLDMGKLAGIHGAGLHFAVTNRHGDNLAQTALGNNTSVQEIWGTQNTHLAILTWEQSFLNDHLTIEAGKSQANIHFLTSPLYCNFQSNSACGNPDPGVQGQQFHLFPGVELDGQGARPIRPALVRPCRDL